MNRLQKMIDTFEAAGQTTKPSFQISRKFVHGRVFLRKG